jgi:DNA-binding response OmpR family regulator
MNVYSFSLHSRFTSARHNAAVHSTDPDPGPTRFVHGCLVMDRLRRRVTLDGQPVTLTAREFALLEFLLHHAGQVVTRPRIAAAIWESDTLPATNLIDVYMLRLRRKLAAAAGAPTIHTLRGLGYMLA